MSQHSEIPAKLGVVAIGRNEGERLRKCLESLVGTAGRVVYTDSGSTDGSVEMARTMGVEVVELDMQVPFTAARARNEGFRRLRELAPDLAYVQFVDGDCEVVAGWLEEAVAFLDTHRDVAVVCARLLERYPERSIYNRLADLEWNASGPGPVDAVGGIFLIRRDAFDSVGGFDSTIPAGEEPELCQRLIRRGWRLLRLDSEMATHDLAITRFAQWWRRMVRSGYGSLDVAYRFGVARFSRNTRRTLGWTAWLIATVAVGAIAVLSKSANLAALTAILFALWPMRLIRIALRILKEGQPWRIAGPYAFLMAICFLPESLGQMRYLADRLRNRSLRLPEYKAGSGSKNGD